MSRVLAVTGLEKVFTVHALGRVIPALRDVSFTVEEGEHLVVTGASGSGKSSLLRCIYRTYLPTAGAIIYRTGAGSEVDIAQLEDQRAADLRHREVGYVSQFFRSEPRRSAYQMTLHAARRRGMSPAQAEQAATEALGNVGLDRDLWKGHPVMMSGGEQQRINIAVATVAPPRLLLLDEPISALDIANSNRVLGRIERLRAEGVTILSVLHDWTLIHRLADRVIVLEDGSVRHIGRPEELMVLAGAEVG
jgi:alpha-D-ribose 1-methylphosphonate 5-triphosphate synthase subunit PhnL